MAMKSAIFTLACSIFLASTITINFHSHFPILQTYREKLLGAWTPWRTTTTTTTTANYHSSTTTTTTTSSTTFTSSASSSPTQPQKQPDPTIPDVPSQMSIARGIAKAFKAIEKAEGAGAKVRRSVGVPQLRNFSPFLMLDHFSVGVGAGFPDHPHRGQETITYLLSGSIDHEDFAGNKGTIHTGDLQFMTAGRGIVHAEMPGESADGSPNVGLQLWVDLPKELKYCEPRYRDLRASEIPTVDADDGRVTVKIISGNSHGVDSVRDLAYTPVWILDVTIQPGGKLVQALPKGWNAFAYVLQGDAVIFGDRTKVAQHYNVVFDQVGDGVQALVPENAEGPARFVIIAGQPHSQPVVQYGPFVVTSNEEVYQAMRDYQSNMNGFERARGWQSEIGKTMLGA